MIITIINEFDDTIEMPEGTYDIHVEERINDGVYVVNIKCAEGIPDGRGDKSFGIAGPFDNPDDAIESLRASIIAQRTNSRGETWTPKPKA